MLDYSKIKRAPVSFEQPVAEQIWRSKYQYKTRTKEIDHTVSDTWLRVAKGLAQVEKPTERDDIAGLFYEAMTDFRLLPAGRILAGTGTQRNVTLCNTFVMRTIPDSVAGILDVVKDAALTMQMGGGIGLDFSTLRPKGTLVRGLDCAAAGPIAAMEICDTVCSMLVTGMGRGAMMATLRCDHPDLEAFINAKSRPGQLSNFNMSVMITDAFMQAVLENTEWELVWLGETVRRVKARHLWDLIMQQAYDVAEPGVLFIDRINATNPLGYLEQLSATNSCAEQPLPPNGTCPLASINLARLVTAPFGHDARLDLDELRRLTGIAVRMLDNVIDLSRFATPSQQNEAHSKRRIGIGVTGVADALVMLGIRYGSAKAARLLGVWMQTLQNAAYLASARLAADRQPFPLYDRGMHLPQPNIRALDAKVRKAITAFGLRNGVLTTIAPTGTTSIYAGNVSSGIEPIFATSYKRKITGPGGTKTEDMVEDYATWFYRQMFGTNDPLPRTFVTAQNLSPDDHVRMQAAAQRWVDSGISKTVNCPEDIPFKAFKDVYRKAFDAGCKGCTTHRPNDITGSVLSV